MTNVLKKKESNLRARESSSMQGCGLPHLVCPWCLVDPELRDGRELRLGCYSGWSVVLEGALLAADP